MQIRGSLLTILLVLSVVICMAIGYAVESSNDTPELMTMEELRNGTD